jgi:hypothetical protein
MFQYEHDIEPNNPILYEYLQMDIQPTIQVNQILCNQPQKWKHLITFFYVLNKTF